MVEEIKDDGQTMAIIISSKFNREGIHFFTPDDYSQQLAYIKHGDGKSIPPHVHNPVKREVTTTQEVLVIRSGKLRVDFYNDDREYTESRVLGAGDIILLARGGHGFEVLEEVEMIEVKQGPYAGEQDKTRFEAVSEKLIKLPVNDSR